MTIPGQNPANDYTHARILKSTTIIGGASALNVVFRILQGKIAAVLIGPSGVGLMGLFNAILGLAGTLAGMGLGTSGVRQIAEASGSGDGDRIARTVLAFRRLAFSFGVLGALILLLFRQPIAQLTFGNQTYAAAVGWLSVAVFLTTISSAQSAFIRGMRQVGDLARVSVLGIAIGTIAGVPLLYFLGEDGVVPYLVFSAVTTITISWWYARKIPIANINVAWRGLFGEMRALLSLGGIFMVSGLITMTTTYLVRVVVTRQMGLEAAGLYEAASALSNVYVGFILAAMGADFFPHLSSIIQDRQRSTALINAQVEIGVLIATPGILAALALGPYLLQWMYSASFVPAYEIFRWQVLGTFLRVISWPVGMVTLAYGKGKAFFGTELAANVFYLGFAAVGVWWFELPGIGIAFFLMYIFYVCMVTLVARHLIDFQWSMNNLRWVAVFLPVIWIVFLASFIGSSALTAMLGLGLTILIGLYSLRTLYRLGGSQVAQAYWLRIKARLGWRKT